MRARARNTQALAASALLWALAWTGCFPEPDVNKMKCTVAKGCPSGYTCTNTGTEWLCKASVDGSPSPDTPMVTPSDGSSMDGVVRSDGVGLDVMQGDAVVLDGGDAPTDTPASEIGTGFGGSGGSGGASGGGGSGGWDGADAPLGGSMDVRGAGGGGAASGLPDGGVTGAGGITSLGGSTGLGGHASTGGVTTSGGGGDGTASGGANSSGGSMGSGGTTASGGVGTGGGLGGTGGVSGQPGSGGVAAGGQTGTGGSTVVTCAPPPLTGGTYAADANGVTFTVGSSKMRVQVCQADIIRVQYTNSSTIPTKNSLSVSNTWATPPSFCLAESSGTVTIITARIKAKVNESTGVVSYTDLSDNVILSEYSKSVTAATVQGTSTNGTQTVFNSPASEGLFGLGQHPDNVMNFKGNTENNMVNSNGRTNIPMLISSKGYGVFWDNYSSSSFTGSLAGNTQFSYSAQAGEGVDYYFFYGPSIDHIIAGYRTTTGAAPLFPKWAYGLFQSKDHYSTQTDYLNVVSGYRGANIPVDVVVQDWAYWGSYSWGSHIMDPTNYPDPATLLSTAHTAHIHGMISIWPEYQYMATPPAAVDGENDQDNYNALNAISALYPSGGTHHFYDSFNSSARTLVYQQIYDRLLGKYGWDAIMADNTEPQAYPDTLDMNSVDTALGKGALYINAYPLQHSKGLYEGWRQIGPGGKRVFILSRSAFAGVQRYGAAEWSGDIQATWAVFATQIPAGLNYAAAGMPYWTTDIGGFFGTPTEELFTRWFQFGAFCPIFRIHGQAPKELYTWSTTAKTNLLAIDTLHYRLMPYLYSLAWRVTNEGYTIMRPLVFDYQNDSNVFGIADQFMYGPAILVNPVTTAGAVSRSVYLPAGTWYDFWAGSTATGGNTVSANAPLSQIPLFVKAGSIVPMGPAIQYATQSVDPLEIRIYKGQDGSFILYEDEGDTYNYESRQYSQISFDWSESAQKLTIGARTGSYTGMPTSRTFNIVWVGPNHGNGVDVTATADQVVTYDGSVVVVAANH